MKRSFFCSLVVVFAALLSFAAIGITRAAAFTVPEKLVYDLTWAGIKAGTATLEIERDSDSMRIISTARSADWISIFYTVDDRTESVVSRPLPPAHIGFPQNYHMKMREGRHRRDKEVIFDRKRHTAVYVDHLAGERKELDARGRVFDPLSGLYYVRTLRFELGTPVFVDILDSKKLWNVEVQILKKERITTRLGTFDTIVIRPLMKSEGIFNRRGDMYIWLTDDERRLPVKMQTKAAVGSITATLAGGQY